MKIDNVIVKVDPTIFSVEDLNILVANSKLAFPFGRLSKIVVTANKNGTFDFVYSVKEQTNFWKNDCKFIDV